MTDVAGKDRPSSVAGTITPGIKEFFLTERHPDIGARHLPGLALCVGRHA
jgi:hypothetical protein